MYIYPYPYLPLCRTRRWLEVLYNDSPQYIHHGYKEQQAVVECMRDDCLDIRTNAALVPWPLFNALGSRRVLKATVTSSNILGGGGEEDDE